MGLVKPVSTCREKQQVSLNLLSLVEDVDVYGAYWAGDGVNLVQLARAMAVIANDGYLVRHMVKK